MKTIKRIFYDDVISLVKNFFALVIVVGICFLPALYAWFNIYSNWDPYANTGALKIAAVSLDKGYTDENGEFHNQGDTIIENLHENTAVNWQFVETSDQAIQGVYSGDYYAAVVIDENFTYDMYNVLNQEVKRPTLHFYENQKKNPVATKISDTVVQSLQNNINVAFTEVVVSTAFADASEFSAKLEEDGGLQASIDKMRTLSADLTAYQNTINQIIANDAQLQQSLALAQQDATNLQANAYSAANALGDSANVSAQADTTITSYINNVNAMLKSMMEVMGDMSGNTQNLSSEDYKERIKASVDLAVNIAILKKQIEGIPQDVADQYLTAYKDQLDTIAKVVENDPTYGPIYRSALAAYGTYEGVQAVKDQATNDLYAQYQQNGGAEHVAETVAVLSDDMKDSVKKLNELLNEDVASEIGKNLSQLTNTLNDANSVLNTTGEIFGNLNVMFGAIGNSVDCANTSLQKTRDAIVYVNGRLIEILDEVDSVDENDKVSVLINALSGDPETYGKFFSTPVEVETKAIYAVENYGSAVAPFYSTLAFWVGALILTAIIKVKPDKKLYPEASEGQLFFGRYVLYWVLGQIQSVVVVVGDLLLLHVQCLHPWLFLLAGSVIATTFTILIYSLVVTWGDAGKALAVVIVVIQIAGSSGTYPIELLPDFFKKVYIFFPFPYAINAIRECLCGLYELDYLKYLGCLVIFMAVSLVIGLLIRIPFEPINHYMEERMEDTEMM